MSTLDDEIAALREAYTSGARRVVFMDGSVRKEVEYPSGDDLKRRLDNLLAEKAGQTGGRSRASVASFGSGW